MKILNLTQHAATAEQKSAGVVEPKDKQQVQSLLTFDAIPTPIQLESAAEVLAQIAASHRADAAMIGGAPFFMSSLESALMDAGVTPLYAFSRRESVEETQPDGSVLKRNVFRHLGFVKPCGDAPAPRERFNWFWENGG